MWPEMWAVGSREGLRLLLCVRKGAGAGGGGCLETKETVCLRFHRVPPGAPARL